MKKSSNPPPPMPAAPMTQAPQKKKRSKLVMLLAFMAFGFVGCVGIIAVASSGGGSGETETTPAQQSAEGGSNDSQDDANQAGEPAAPEAAAVEREEFGVDFDLLSTNAQEMTELQFDDSKTEFIGTEIGWFGVVEEVQEELFGEGLFEVVVDPEGGSGILERARLQVPRDLALAIPANAEVFFTGTITDIDNVIALGVSVNNVTIEGRDGTAFTPVAAADASSDSASDTTAQVAGGLPTFDTFSTNAQDMTEVQFDDWVAGFIGTEFTMTGQVESVDEALFEEGQFEIVVDVLGGSGVLERARLLVTRDEALSVPLNAQITFTGPLSEADNLISLSLLFRDVNFTIE